MLYFKGIIQEFNNMNIFFSFFPRLRWNLFLSTPTPLDPSTQNFWQVWILVFVQALHTLILFVICATQGHNEFPLLFPFPRNMLSLPLSSCRSQFCAKPFLIFQGFFLSIFETFDRICLHLKHIVQMSVSPLHYFSHEVIALFFFCVIPRLWSG